MISKLHRMAPIALLASVSGGCAVTVVDLDLPPYEVCDFNSDCDPVTTDGCFDVTVDDGLTVSSSAICSLICDSDLDCPDSAVTFLPGACIAFFFEDPICYERCEFSTDCPAGFDCLDAAGDFVFDPVCLPAL